MLKKSKTDKLFNNQFLMVLLGLLTKNGKRSKSKKILLDTLYDFKVINDSALSEIRDLYVSIKREYESKEKLYEERFQANEERFQVNERKLEGIKRILDNIISTASAPCAVASFSGGGKRRKKYSKKKKKSKTKSKSKSKTVKK